MGPIPPTPYYSPNGMSQKDREAFLAWHQDMCDRDYLLNFQEEIVDYCRSDVDILRRCCMEFRELFHEITDIDPFTTLTIAAACHKVYRTNYLAKDTTAFIPPMGYAPKNKHSLFPLKWVTYTAEKEEIDIQHACNGGEKHVGDYFLDGYHEETHTAYEVEGCFWHRCPRCYTRDTVNSVNGKTMHELYQSTMKKIEFLKKEGYNVVEVWERDIKREMDEDMKHYEELLKALEKGYQLLQIHEVWHFPQKTDTLFKEYIDTFTKIKLELANTPRTARPMNKSKRMLTTFWNIKAFNWILLKLYPTLAYVHWQNSC